MSGQGQGLPDFYGVLGVGFDATHADLRKAWREAVKRWHPDRNPGRDVHAQMARVNEAWEVLGDPVKRAAYDSDYFKIRAARANREREVAERKERARRDEQERRRRESEAARMQAEAEARRRAEEEARQRAHREREARERNERARRDEHARRERMEQERHERERRTAEERRRRAERDAEEARQRRREEQGHREQQGRDVSGSGSGREASGGIRRGPVVVFTAIAAVLFLGLIAAGFLVFLNSQDATNEAAVPVVQVSVRPTATPLVPTPTPAVRYVAAAIQGVDPGWLDSIQPGSVHEYLMRTFRPTGYRVRELIAAGADFGYIEEVGFGSLFLAASIGADSEVFEALIDAGEDASRNSYLLHALMWSDNVTLDAVQVLIDADADLEFVDVDGLTALDIALARDEVPKEVVAALVDAQQAEPVSVRVNLDHLVSPTSVVRLTRLPSSPTPILFQGAIPAPANFAAHTGINSGEIELAWSVYGSETYEVRYKLAHEDESHFMSWQRVGPVSWFTLTGLSAGSMYDVQIRVSAPHAFSEPSAASVVAGQ